MLCAIDLQIAYECVCAFSALKFKLRQYLKFILVLAETGEAVFIDIDDTIASGFWLH